MPNKDKIRFLFISQDTLNIVGGGRITLRKLISFLNKHLIIDIIDVVSLPHGNYSLEYYFGDNHGINYSNYFNPKIFNYLHLPKELLILIRELYFSLIFKYKIRKINPDLVFVQGITITVPVEFKSIYFVRDVYYGDNLVNLSKWKKKILIPVAYFRKLRLRNFNLLIANSSYLCNKVSRYNNSVEILYPFVDPIDSKKGSNDRKYLTFLNPSREKGIRIFISIAEKLQNKSFMVVGKISSKNRMILQRMENVTYVPWTNEINKIYHDTRILLVPSISTETFGRVVIEAAQFGIPAIVSNQGGLPEAIGKSGLLVDNIFDVSEWLNNIQKFDDAQFYNSMSDEARKHAKNFYTNNINQSFRSILFRNFNLRF